MDNTKHNIKRKINKIYREKGRFPTVQEMNNILSYTHEQTFNYMKALEEDGTVIRKGDWYTFPDDIEILEEKEDLKDKSLSPIGDYLPVTEKIDKALEERGISIDPVKETSIFKETVVKEKFKLGSSKIKKLKNKFKRKSKNEKTLSLEETKSKRNKSDKIKGQKKKYKKKTSTKIQEDLTLAMYIIRGVMLFVGIGSIAISIYYNIQLSMEFLPGIFAVIGGCIFVLFAVVSFETIIYFIVYKMSLIKKIVAVGGFVFLWLIVTLFSMSAVFSGRYHRYMVNEKIQSSDNRTINAGKLRWQNIQEQKADVQKRMEEKRRQLDQLYKISEGITDLESRKKNEDVFKNTQWRISLAEKDLKKLTIKLDIIRKAELKQLDKNPETTDADMSAGNNDDFYEWLAKIFGTTKENIHFLISLAPALFFDIVSSVAVSIFLFLRRQ